MLLYEKVAARIGAMIENGTYRSGERIPSIRALSQQMLISANTVMEAYAYLENLGMVEAREKRTETAFASIPLFGLNE